MELKSYKEATQHVVLFEDRERAYFEIKGDDCKKYLQGLVTNDVLKLKPQAGCYNLHITPKGKLIADFCSYSCGDYFGIDVASALKAKLLESFKKYIIFQKVEIVDQSAKRFPLVVMGPKAKEFLTGKVGGIPSEDLTYLGTTCGDSDLWLIQRDRWGLPAYELWERNERLSTFREKLALPTLESKVQEILRIESATPKFGVDMDENTIPQEANLHHALSFDKGCYVGQEIVARLEHRGHVGKQLVLLKMDGNLLPKAGEKITNEEKKEIGFVTSSCFSPKHKTPLALGYIRYPFLNQTTVRVSSQEATVLKATGQ